MILGAVQVVVNVVDLAAAEAPLAAAGFTRSFTEPALASHPAKATLLARPRSALAMTHLAPAEDGRPAPAVELTAYAGEPPAGEAAYVLEAGPDRRPRRVLAPTPDPEASGAFWDALGARAGDDGARRFGAALPAWRLEVATPAGPDRAGATTLDADGCVLVSVLCTAVEADLARLERRVALGRGSGAWQEEVAGRALTVAVVEGPAGELVEMLQIPSGPWR